VFFGAARNMTILFGEDADSAGGDSMIDYGLVVLAYDVDAEYFGWKVSNNSKRYEKGHAMISSDLKFVWFILEPFWAE
jgi:hypothetical protein